MSDRVFQEWLKQNDLNTYRLSKLWGVDASHIQSSISRGEPTWALVMKLSDRIVTLQNDNWLKEQELLSKKAKENGGDKR